MVASAAAGELVDCGGGPFSLIEMQAWGEERTVRAAVLRHLLIGKDWPTMHEASGCAESGSAGRWTSKRRPCTARCIWTVASSTLSLSASTRPPPRC